MPSPEVQQPKGTELGPMKFKKISKEQLQILVRNSSSHREVLFKLGCSLGQSFYNLKERLIQDGITTDHFSRKNVAKFGYENPNYKTGRCSRKKRICGCGEIFVTEYDRKFCRFCKPNNRYKNDKERQAYLNYRRRCRFKNLPPREGMSPDHRFSIAMGWKMNVDSKIMSHPANLEWLPNKENQSKGSKCSLNLEELMTNIEHWKT